MGPLAPIRNKKPLDFSGKAIKGTDFKWKLPIKSGRKASPAGTTAAAGKMLPTNTISLPNKQLKKITHVLKHTFIMSFCRFQFPKVVIFGWRTPAFLTVTRRKAINREAAFFPPSLCRGMFTIKFDVLHFYRMQSH